MVKLIIDIPALNEEEQIGQVIASLPKNMNGIDTIEFLVVDDGSTDATTITAREAGAMVIRHPVNRGVGAAFQSAMRHALENGADLLVTVDADGQFDAAEIPMLIEPILDGQADMVVGNRFAFGIPANMPRLKYWGNQQVAKLIRTIAGQTLQDVSCGFRAYSREALLRLNIFGEFTYTHETIISLAYQGLRVAECPISVRYFQERRSRVADSVLRYAIQTSKIILRTTLDYRPLRIFGTLGSVLVGIGVLFEAFLLGHYFLTQAYSPYKALGFIGLAFIVFGMLVLIIALVADMINRMRLGQDKVLYELKKMRYGEYK
jgi:glycosyltransferase involved in cell wall biosynthesis